MARQRGLFTTTASIVFIILVAAFGRLRRLWGLRRHWELRGLEGMGRMGGDMEVGSLLKNFFIGRRAVDRWNRNIVEAHVHR